MKTYGPVNPLETEPRYTSLVEVKKALGITDTSFDADLTTAIVAAEVAIDTRNNRSFPDTGDDPAVEGIPEAIRVWALDVSIAVFKARDTTYGQGGSDEWLGIIDIQDEVGKALRRNPLALGWKGADWGGLG